MERNFLEKFLNSEAVSENLSERLNKVMLEMAKMKEI